jgi:hypothetical protein
MTAKLCSQALLAAQIKRAHLRHTSMQLQAVALTFNVQRTPERRHLAPPVMSDSHLS